jgi:uncharacterized protein YgiB involved in biofilm formation
MTAVLAGCDDDDDGMAAANAANSDETAALVTFAGASSCDDTGIYSSSTCFQLDSNARAEWDATKPHYNLREDCEKDSDDCEPDYATPPQGGGSGVYIFHSSGSGGTGGYGWSPSYKGFTVAQPAPGTGAPMTVHPVYSTSGGLTTPHGITGLAYNQAMTVPRTAFDAPIARSFFGAGRSMTTVSPVGGSFIGSPAHPSMSVRGGFVAAHGLGSVGG